MQPLRIGLVISNGTLWDQVQTTVRELPVQVVLQQQSLGDWNAFVDQVKRLQPDVLLLDLTELREFADQVMRTVKALPSAPFVIALNTAADSETILGSMRAGANEYLFPPLATGLGKALERMALERSQTQATQRQHGGKTIGLFSAKGGCGATTVACHLAVELQKATSQDVLLADFDMDAGMVGFLLKAKSSYTMIDAVRNIHRLDASYWKALVSNGRPQLETLSAPPAGSIDELPPPDQFREVLRFARSAYDWIVCDLGRSLNRLTAALMEDLDQTFLVAQLDLQSLHQAKQVIQGIQNYGYNRERLNLLLNRMPRRPDISPEQVEKILGLPVYATLPDDYEELFEAFAHGDLVSQNCELGKQFQKLAMKIAGVQPEEKPKQKISFSLF